MSEILRQPRIGITSSDLNYSKDSELIAEETGLYIAQAGAMVSQI